MSEIVEDYKQSLTELTFNSRPIIDTLTVIAGENKQVAEGIVDAVTTRIYKCVPEQKLFSLYLLDSICKNVGRPYNVIAGQDIFKLFSHVYLLVESGVRKKLLNLYETWKLTKTKGTNSPLFPPEELEKIGNFLSKANATSSGSNSSNDSLTNTKLIRDIDELLPVFQNKLNSHPNDLKLHDRFNALNQLKFLLQNQKMQLAELKAVETQLSNIRQQELSRASSATPSSNSSTPTGTPKLNNSLPKIPASLPSIPQHINQGNNQNNNNNSISINSNSNNMGRSTLDSIVNLGSNNNSKSMSTSNQLFDQLMNYGIITFEQELKGPRTYIINYPKHISDDQSQNLFGQILSNQMIRSEYDQLKHNEMSKLKISRDNLQDFISGSNISIQCKQLLYETKELKCSICGKRFNPDNVGQTRKRLHLDWHFRISQKFKSSSNVQSRSWYLDDIDWVSFNDDNLLEFQVEGNNNGQSSHSQPKQAQETQEVPYVIIPSSETNMNNKCLICREQVKGTFNEDLGEWYWYNCIVQPGEPQGSRKIVHATCYNETRKRSAVDSLNSNVKRERFH